MPRRSDGEGNDFEPTDRTTVSEAGGPAGERPSINPGAGTQRTADAGHRAAAPRVSEDTQTYTVEQALNRIASPPPVL